MQRSNQTMQLRSATLAVLLGMLNLAATANATTYVVDNGSPAAADTNPGTREAPLKTVSAAAARAVAGDEVIVRPGIYREAVTLTNSGALGKPIVFRSEEPRKAVISGSDVLTNLQAEGLGVWSARVPKKDDINLQSGGNPQWVYMDGTPLERADTRDRLIPGTFYQDTKATNDGWRVYVALPEGKNIKDVTLEYACRDGLICPQGNQGSELPLNDIHIIGFTVMHNADCRGKPAILVTGQRWLVEGNHVLWASYWGGILMRFSNQAIVRSNLVEWIGCQGMGGLNNVDLLLEGNTLRYNNWRSLFTAGEGGGSKWVCNIDACYRGNEVAFNCGPGLWNDTASAGTIYEKNICHDNGGRALFSEANWDEVIQDNIVYNTGEFGILISNGPGMVIRRNIVFNNGIGIGLSGNYTRPTGADPQWYRNAATRMATVPGIAPHRVTLWEAQFLKYIVAPKACLNNNCVVWDNILFDNCRSMMEQRDYRTPSSIDGFVNNFSDYNIYWHPSEKTLFNFDYSYQYESFAAWQKASGRDEHSVVADPRDPKTKLPEWAQACRKDWDLKMRSITEVDGLRDDGVKQELFTSPMAQIAIGRMLRSPYLKAEKA